MIFWLSLALAFADTQSTFHALFERELGASVADLHFVADEAVTRALAAPTLDEAMRLQAAGSLKTLAATPVPKVTAPEIPKIERPLTLVLVPGVFAEFIKTRAFEEVFEKPSVEAEKYKRLIADQRAFATVDRLRDWMPGQPAVASPRPFENVVPMGEIKVGPNTVRVILFGTEFGTLESLGDARERAKLFNARLEKYLEITGDQDLAFIGYSRGTVLGLEMLAQANAAGRPWVTNVKAVVSLSGVNFGSTLADDAVANASSAGNRAIGKLKELLVSLELIDHTKSYIEMGRTVLRNNQRWEDFFAAAAVDIKEMNAGKPLALTTLLQVDPRSPVGIVAQMWAELGLWHPLTQYNANVERFRFFIKELLTAIGELSTASRETWWRENVLPPGPTYYALGAAMANPAAADPEPRLFKNKQAYGSGSYDDVGLLQNHIDYTKLSGVELNDSQVSVAQAAFLSGPIAAANPANAGLKTAFLGVAGTHHWGLALREVNSMWFGQNNGYPREALLRALAAQIIVGP